MAETWSGEFYCVKCKEKREAEWRGQGQRQGHPDGEGRLPRVRHQPQPHPRQGLSTDRRSNRTRNTASDGGTLGVPPFCVPLPGRSPVDGRSTVSAQPAVLPGWTPSRAARCCCPGLHVLERGDGERPGRARPGPRRRTARHRRRTPHPGRAPRRRARRGRRRGVAHHLHRLGLVADAGRLPRPPVPRVVVRTFGARRWPAAPWTCCARPGSSSSPTTAGAATRAGRGRRRARPGPARPLRPRRRPPPGAAADRGRRRGGAVRGPRPHRVPALRRRPPRRGRRTVAAPGGAAGGPDLPAARRRGAGAGRPGARAPRARVGGPRPVQPRRGPARRRPGRPRSGYHPDLAEAEAVAWLRHPECGCWWNEPG